MIEDEGKQHSVHTGILAFVGLEVRALRGWTQEKSTFTCKQPRAEQYFRPGAHKLSS